MVSPIKKKIKKYLDDNFRTGHVRSIKAKKNIFASIIIKGLSICISLILVPLTINYVDSSRYGIWLTISSVVAWLSFFDIGLSQGLRNKFAEAKARQEDDKAQIYVSTSYALLGIIFFLIWITFVITNQFLNWSDILHINNSLEGDVSVLGIIVFTYFCISFVLKILTTVLLADQHPAKSAFLDFLGQMISLILIIILVKTTEGSLIRLGIALCFSPFIVLVAANLFFFNGPYRRYKPTIKKVDFKYAKDLFNLGLVFFVIQIAAIIQFQTANIIIARNFGTEDVTAYNIVFKYFGIVNMVFTIFITPFWSASTEAYQNNDIQWIKNGIKKYTKLNILLIFIGLIMLIVSDDIYKLWLGEGKVSIAFSLSLWGFLYFNVLIYGGKYVNFLNGISALRLQFISSLISPFIYIGVAMVLIKVYHLGVYSLFIASIIANFNAYLLSPIQYRMVIVKKSNSPIWYK